MNGGKKTLTKTYDGKHNECPHIKEEPVKALCSSSGILRQEFAAHLGQVQQDVSCLEQVHRLYVHRLYENA